MTPTDAYTPAVVKYAGFLYMFQLEFPDKDAFPFLKDMFKMNVITHNSDNWLSFVDGEDYLDGVFFDEVESQTRFKKSSFLPDDFNIRVHFNSSSYEESAIDAIEMGIPGISSNYSFLSVEKLSIDDENWNVHRLLERANLIYKQRLEVYCSYVNFPPFCPAP